MYILKETFNELQKLGITPKIYPDDYESFKKRCWDKEYKYFKDYHKDWNSPYCHTWIKTVEQYELEAKKWADERYMKDVNDWYNADILYIEYDGRIIVKKENVKSKLITTDYILKLVEKDKKLYNGVYGNFAIKMQNLLKREGFNCDVNVYPTTYGIGVWVFWWSANGWIDKVRKILDSKGIEYYNEYSDAAWVYRFKISKRKENLERI